MVKAKIQRADGSKAFIEAEDYGLEFFKAADREEAIRIETIEGSVLRNIQGVWIVV